MNISDLKDGLKGVDIEGVITLAKEPRTVHTKNGDKKVRNFDLKDASGEVTLVLWEGDIDRVKEGSVVSISKGYVTQWQGKLQLNIGRWSKMNVDGQ